MENAQAMVYSEVYGILNMLGENYIKLIPIKLYNFIKENKSIKYNPNFDNSIPLEQQNISKNATAFICMLHYNYWCTTEEEKAKMDKVLQYNQNKKMEELSKYKDDLFGKNETKTFQNQTMENNVENANYEQVPVVIQKETIFTRFINFFKKLFKKQ